MGVAISLTLAGCSSAGSHPPVSTTPGSAASASSSTVPPNVLLGIAAAERACMNLGDAITKQHDGASAGDIGTAMTAANGSARAAAEQDVRWSAFANDVGAISGGAATAAGTARVGTICTRLSQDASYFTTHSP